MRSFAKRSSPCALCHGPNAIVWSDIEVRRTFGERNGRNPAFARADRRQFDDLSRQMCRNQTDEMI